MILTSEKVTEFVSLYPTTKNSELAVRYGVKQSTIRNWAALEKVVKAKGFYFWEPLEERYLARYYHLMTKEQMAEKLGKTKWGVINKYRELSGLRKKWEKRA